MRTLDLFIRVGLILLIALLVHIGWVPVAFLLMICFIAVMLKPLLTR